MEIVKWVSSCNGRRQFASFAAGLAGLSLTFLQNARADAPRSPHESSYEVCAQGCRFNDPLEAFRAAIIDPRLMTQDVVIRISDGNYRIHDQFYSETPFGNHLRIIGNEKDNSRVVLVFDKVGGTNFNGFMAARRGIIGFINGVTLNAEGAQVSHSPSGTSWRSDSYGAGIIARTGGYIRLGQKVTVNHFYYSVEADEAGIIDAGDGGVISTDAGDVNFMARHDGVLICPGCHADRAADTTRPPTLGCNFTAEDGGVLRIDGSTGRNSYTGGLCLLTTSHAWARHLTLSGGLGGRTGSGIWASENSFAETEGSTIRGYRNGIYANNGGGLDVSRDRVTDNAQDGMVADGGRLVGGDSVSSDNGGFGYHAFHEGILQIYGARGKAVNNHLGAVAAESGGRMADLPFQGSSAILP